MKRTKISKMFTIKMFAIISLAAALTSAACGSSSTTTGSAGGSDSGGDTSGFQVLGTLSSLQVAPSLGAKTVQTSGTVTDVMAVSPQTASVGCETAEVESDGSFALPITANRPWFLFFFDRSETGIDMFLGWLRSSTLDTLTPTSSSGSLDLESVSIDGDTGIATSSVDYTDIIAGLGLDSDIADVIGDQDDLSSRYSNPDIDGNGEVDCNNSTNDYLLDFHVRFDMKENGTGVSVNDIIDDYLSDSTTTASYTNTGIYVSYLSSFSSADTGTVTFVDTAVTTQEAGALAANTPTSQVTTNDYGDYNGFGPNMTNSSELPAGEIIFSFGDKTLTFANVQTPTLAQLTDPIGRIFPFIKFNKTSSSCSSNCTLSGVGYKWMKRSATGWSAPTLTELDLLVKDDTPNISIWVDNNAGKVLGIPIPKTALEGTIDWSSSNANLEGVTEAEFDAIVTTQICHLAVSYDDKLGMRYFEGIAEAAGTCS